MVDCALKHDDKIFDKNILLSDDSNLIQVNLDCQLNDQVKCNKVENTFKLAGEIINYALVLNTPIIVNAIFRPLGNPKVLGGAAASRLISIPDDEDNTERLYPQALVKQLGLQIPIVKFASSDIIAQFNSLKDWYFPDDEGSIRPDQNDILNTVLHELIHGLGFFSSWKNYLDEQLQSPTSGLTPIFSSGSNATSNLPFGSFEFTGFYETIFDKFIMINNDGKQEKLSMLANELNQFSGKNKLFTHLSSFNDEFRNSPQYEAAKKMLSLSMVKNSLIFMPKGTTKINDGLILETSLGTYATGSSIVHVDYNKYSRDSDFLMIYNSVAGISMNDLIKKTGNRTGTAIGPKLLKALNSIGYTLADNPIKFNRRYTSYDGHSVNNLLKKKIISSFKCLNKILDLFDVSTPKGYSLKMQEFMESSNKDLKELLQYGLGVHVRS
ncbi:3557_t:CDS:2 [Funneliformis geosporum]|uniref:3557_t:CDS:1 n=1 Tax=Funneliformis geosporum TaxID=1117311 RepID=A0A9W4SHP2_9GLOM|nr:3557_t:CDS:2 [Funneliformis geosporum]